MGAEVGAVGFAEAQQAQVVSVSRSTFAATLLTPFEEPPMSIRRRGEEKVPKEKGGRCMEDPLLTVHSKSTKRKFLKKAVEK